MARKWRAKHVAGNIGSTQTQLATWGLNSHKVTKKTRTQVGFLGLHNKAQIPIVVVLNETGDSTTSSDRSHILDGVAVGITKDDGNAFESEGATAPPTPN